MKKKSIKLMILTALIVASFTTNVVYAAKPNFNEKNASADHKQGNYNKNTNKIDQKQENFNKKTSKEVYILSKKLDQIENSYKKINVKLEEYFNEINDSETTTGSSITTDVSTETTTDSTETTDVSTETLKNTQIGNEKNQSVELEKEYDSEDIEQDEDIDEDRQVSNSFYGKLNAVMNRLNTIKRQLNSLGSLNNEDISKLNSRTDELINQVKACMDKVSGIQSENIQSLQKKSDKKVMKDENITEQKKSWKIHFSKSIDPGTINSKSVMIIDSKNNILDVDVSYNKDTNDIIIETKDGFVKSEIYSILISSDVKSTDGKRLQRTIEKRFSVQ